MPCAEFEDLLVDYAELAPEARLRVDEHAGRCARCREFLAALQTVDAALTARFVERRVSDAFTAAVRERVRQAPAIRRPSLIPEFLDFAGWGAIVALSALLLWWIAPMLPAPKITVASTFSVAYGAGAAFLLVSILVGLRSFSYLKH